MHIIDTYPALLAAFDGPAFRCDKWQAYLEANLPGLLPVLTADVQETLGTGQVTWEQDYLPVLNAVATAPALREKAHDSFCRATANLEARIQAQFGRSPDVDIVFYLGLCNGAGWVTEYRGRRAILLGIEKIMELGWCGPDDMIGLIYHELGHCYQAQYGVLHRTGQSTADSFLWQLFTEGIAMVFEQILVGDPDYYHQDKDGWSSWCASHLQEIKADFLRDLPTMTFADQRYFGDWVSYRGHGDVGYYLGARFVRSLLAAHAFEELIGWDIPQVAHHFTEEASR